MCVRNVSAKLEPGRLLMPTERTTSAVMPRNVRSAVTTGSRAFLTKGGDHLSEGERQLARRCATLAIEAETMEVQKAEGGNLDLEAYIALTNALGRALGRLGLRRVARYVTPTGLCARMGLE